MGKIQPQDQYDSPLELANDGSIRRSARIALLKQWHQDLMQKSEAAQEGLTANNSNVAAELQAVTECLNELEPVE